MRQSVSKCDTFSLSQLRGIRGDPRDYIERVWARKLPRLYERLLESAAKGEPVSPLSFEILKAMTAICQTLAPARLPRIAPGAIERLGLPADADLTHLSDEDLARITRKALPMPDAIATKQTKPTAKTKAIVTLSPEITKTKTSPDDSVGVGVGGGKTRAPRARGGTFPVSAKGTKKIKEVK